MGHQEQYNASRAVYARLNKKNYRIIIGLAVVCVVSCVLDILTAAASPAYRLSTKEVLRCLLNPGAASPGTYVIVIKMRLPISLMAVVVGFALGMSGAVMQTILHNPLASPYTLGVGTAAGFGASIAIVLGLGSIATSALAFAFAMLICLMIYMLGRNNVNSGSLVLSGIACLFLFQALQVLPPGFLFFLQMPPAAICILLLLYSCLLFWCFLPMLFIQGFQRNSLFHIVSDAIFILL